MGHINPGDKDSKVYTAEKIIICLDELESSTREDWSYIKSLVTIPKITVRRPYARSAEDLTRRASFCGSANQMQILGDLTGSRRWLIIECLDVDYEAVTPDLMQGVFSQALVMLNEGFQYWFNMNDIQEIDTANLEYSKPNHEEEVIRTLYRPVDAKSINARFLTASKILDELHIKTPSIKFNAIKLGHVLKNMGFERVKKDGVYKYAVETIEG